ncbi:hypothetical protein ARMGADRAFT_1081224 [Armillaria gallica]|uniref:Uncharacterized protein n=1 Tax=Armillaria gallica TaxID=47427 RepID=A0A2H3DLS3_ARMGA|nr:hypothetical protein ARMGADRAFT_1081224 [Armillaria gallica]
MDHGASSSVTDQSLAGESAGDIDRKLIQGMISDAPAAAAKFKVSTLLTIGGKNLRKRKQPMQAGTSDEQPTAKHSKSASKTNDKAFKFVNYIYICKKDPPKAQKPPSQSNSKINYDLYIEKGPFKFTSNQPFEDYTTVIAAMLQCHKSKLILDELKYKQKVPQTSQIHSLTSDLAFTSLIEEMRAAKTVNKWIMYIFSPAPICPASDEVWWTTTNEDGQELVPSGFDFSQLEWQGTEDSIATQRKKFNDTVKPFIVKLEEKFLVDNFLTLFPG